MWSIQASDATSANKWANWPTNRPEKQETQTAQRSQSACSLWPLPSHILTRAECPSSVMKIEKELLSKAVDCSKRANERCSALDALSSAHSLYDLNASGSLVSLPGKTWRSDSHPKNTPSHSCACYVNTQRQAAPTRSECSRARAA